MHGFPSLIGLPDLGLAFIGVHRFKLLKKRDAPSKHANAVVRDREVGGVG